MYLAAAVGGSQNEHILYNHFSSAAGSGSNNDTRYNIQREGNEFVFDEEKKDDEEETEESAFAGATET